jgi:hypothetical protein
MASSGIEIAALQELFERLGIDPETDERPQSLRRDCH